MKLLDTNRLVLAGAILALLAVAQPLSAASYTIDPVHSSALFKIQHFGVSNVYGALWDVTGTITYDEASEADASIEITITTASLDTNNERRDAHISSPDFLDAKQFPTINFVSTAVRPLGQGRYEVVGDLTLHGVTTQVKATADKVGQGPHPRSGKPLIGFETRFTFKRSDFDMEFMLGPLSDEVEIVVSIEAGGS
jgi:polyisoprenoid-binding protein YceI